MLPILMKLCFTNGGQVPLQDVLASDPHIDLDRAPYVSYGLKI